MDVLLREAAAWTPREATLFLLAFDRRFMSATGAPPTHVERFILSSLLRRRARDDP